MPPQRLPIVDSDDGVWGDILRQYLMKEHYNDDTDNAANGGHKTITVRAGTTGAGTAPIKLTSGSLMTAPEVGAIEFLTDDLYFTRSTGTTRDAFVFATRTQTLTNKTLTSPTIGGTPIMPQNTTLELYNTSDQVTNYEKSIVRYNSNILEIGHMYSGTGVSRAVRFGTAAASGVAPNRYIQIQGSTPFVSYNWSGTTLTGQAINIGSGNTFTASSGNQTALGIDPTINQTSTAGYTGLLINPTESGTGSGTKRLIDAQVGGAARFSVDNTGNAIVMGTLDLGNASDTTLSRSSAGILAVEGVAIPTISSTHTLTNKTISGASNTLSNIALSSLTTTGTANSTTYLRGDGQWTAISTGITRSFTTTSGAYTAGSAASTDYIYIIAGAHNGALPTANANANRYTFKNNHSADVTITRDGSDTIEGQTSITLSPGSSVDLVSNGTNTWIII